MDLPNEGTENQVHTSITSKPKPPVSVKKPKPSLPKKPAIAVKPSLIIPTSTAQNGKESEPVSTEPKASCQSSTPGPATEPPTSSVSPARGGSHRPKNPPPPLPKTSPRGGPPSKTPPPLPKNPPRGRLAESPKKSPTHEASQSNIIAATVGGGPESSDTLTDTVRDIPETSVTTAIISPQSEDSIPVPTTSSFNDIAADSVQPDKSFPEESLTTKSVCDNKQTVQVSDQVTNANTAEENFEFSNLKSRFVSLGSKAPIVPVKPKPRVQKKSEKETSPKKTIEKTQVLDSAKNVVNEIEAKTQKGSNSTWFVSDAVTQGDSEEKIKSDVSFKNDKNSSVEFSVTKDESKDTSVRFRKIHSPAQSPPVARKPLPKLPVKPVVVSTDQTTAETGKPTGVQTPDDSSCDTLTNNTKAKAQNTDIADNQSPHKGTENVKETESKTDISDKGDSQTYPKPVPRRPVPAARPRPTPRKRQSLNRLSGTDETVGVNDQFSSVQNLSFESEASPDFSRIKAKSEENVFKAANELKLVQSKGASVEDVSVVDKISSGADKEKAELSNQLKEKHAGGTKVTSLVKSRVVYNDKGEEKQYRIIDKSVVNKSKSDILGDKDKDKDNISEQAQASDKSSSGIAVELRNKFKEIKVDSQENARSKSEDFISVSQDTAGDVSGYSSIDEYRKVPSKKDESSKDKDDDIMKESFEDLLADKSILEPSSLLNEIEEILSRSYKHSSLTRSGSSPDKTLSPHANLRYERSRSVDANTEGVPVRPPRPKKEQKRLRSQSQLMYDSCGSDTESLPDISRSREDIPRSEHKSLTLGPAKPHPPKPKRHKLLKVQRSQSDVTAMKAFVENQEQKKSPQHRRQVSDAGPSVINTGASGKTANGRGVSPGRPTSWKKSRPTRKAPAPPSVPPCKVTPPSPTVDLNYVVPLDSRVKSLKSNESLHKRGEKSVKTSAAMVKESAGSLYQSINDNDVEDSSDGDHDYHEIPEKLSKSTQSLDKGYKSKSMKSRTLDSSSLKSRSPPKLPPRNGNSSQSFETSSISSVGQDFDSVLTGVTSSMEDMSISSSCFEGDSGSFRDLGSPGFKAFSKLVNFPKTSSPYVKDKLSVEDGMHGLGSSPLSGSDVRINHRPASGISLQSDSGSSSQIAGQLTSSDSEGEDEDKVNRKKEKKLRMIAEEIMSSEKVFVDVLVLLNVDFRLHISSATEALGRPVIPNETLNRILDYLPQLQNFNEELLKDLEERLSKWEEKKAIADIFVKKGPFLKLYSSYIRDFETMTSTLDEAVKKYPAFQSALKDFEMSPRCASLALKHYMLKPIQRIPQYRMLLQDYLDHLPADSPEMKDIKTALVIVSEVAHHANENMRHSDYVQKMLEIQRSLIGQFEVIKPGRLFLKEGELMKLSRKEMQPRYFFLFNDVLLYTTPVATGYRLNNVLPLAGMKVSVSAQDEYKMEFSIISVQRSFTLHGATIEERDDWVSALNSAVEENALKRNTFEAVRAGAQDMEVLLDKDFVLGHKAPLWIPDARVTMCMLCTCEFTVTWRRHHCRACGRVVCGNCSDCKAPLRYLKYKPARVCDECFKTLKQEAEKEANEESNKGEDSASVRESEEGLTLSSIKNGFLERFQKIRRSGRIEKKSRPDRLKAVAANDEGASMSGYLHKLGRGKRWKRYWFLVKDKVLYTFKATQDTAAAESMVLLGYEVSRFTDFYEGIEADLLFQLSHSNTSPIVFRTDSATATERWVTVMREASVA